MKKNPYIFLEKRKHFKVEFFDGKKLSQVAKWPSTAARWKKMYKWKSFYHPNFDGTHCDTVVDTTWQLIYHKNMQNTAYSAL